MQSGNYEALIAFINVTFSLSELHCPIIPETHVNHLIYPSFDESSSPEENATLISSTIAPKIRSYINKINIVNSRYKRILYIDII